MSILLSVSTFISTKGNLIDRRSKGYKSITKFGWRLIIVNLIILLLLLLQFYINESKAVKKEIEFKNIQDERDSILRVRYDSSLYQMKAKFDSSNLKIINTVTNGLGQYGFKLDSTNNKLVKIIRESANQSPDPVLVCNSFKLVKKIGDVSKYSLELRSFDASSNDIDVDFYIYGHHKANYIHLLSKEKLLIPDEKITTNGGKVFNPNLEGDTLYTYLYINLQGTYKNTDKSKTYIINEYYQYNILNDDFGGLVGFAKPIKLIQEMQEKNLERIKY